MKRAKFAGPNGERAVSFSFSLSTLEHKMEGREGGGRGGRTDAFIISFHNEKKREAEAEGAGASLLFFLLFFSLHCHCHCHADIIECSNAGNSEPRSVGRLVGVSSVLFWFIRFSCFLFVLQPTSSTRTWPFSYKMSSRRPSPLRGPIPHGNKISSCKFLLLFLLFSHFLFYF